MDVDAVDKNLIYLAQTDTTAGFCSQNLKKLNAIKNRPENQPCLITVAKFGELKKLARVPKKYKNLVRKSQKTTILYPNLKAIRVVKDEKHAKFLVKFGWMYSTSANLHGQKFNLEFAKNVVDVIADSEFSEKQASRIFKLSKNKIKKIR